MKMLSYILFMCYILDNFVNGGVIHKSKNDDLFRLDIIHYNDFHARFEETSIPYPVCRTNDSSCLGGFSRLYHEIKTLLKEKPEALLLNAGDAFQGSYWYTLFKWNITQKFINMLPIDVHVIGNHEFDDGVAGLAPYLAALRAPVVVANMDTSKEPSLDGLYVPNVILERKGRKIGIIGLITTETRSSSAAGGVEFLDPVATAREQAELLTKEGVNIIIVLSHCGLDVDKQIAKEVGNNIDIIVGGHTHSLLWNGESPSHEKVDGPYPVLVETESKPGHKVLIVQALAFTKYLGNLTAYFDKHGDLQSFDGVPVFLNRSIPEDPEINVILQRYKNQLHSLVNEVVGYTNDDMLSNLCGSRECAIGDVISDAFVDSVKEMNISSLPHVGLLIRSMIRGSIAKGDITRGTIINTLPFTNKVVTFVLPGRYIVEALEKCLTVHWNVKPFNGPRMPQISGLRVSLNTTSGRAESVSVEEGEEYYPIDMNKDYQFTTVKFLYSGGHDFTMFKEHGRNLTIVGSDSDILENYVRKITPISPKTSNRLKVIN